MDFPTLSHDANSPLEEAVIRAGFLSFYKAKRNCFAELLGAAIMHHVSDNTQPMLANLREWTLHLDQIAIYESTYRMRGGRKEWAELKRIVIEFLRARMPTQTAGSVLSGVVPDRANVDAFNAIASILHVAILWTEEIEGELVTKCFHNSDPGTWVFYLYFASERDTVYALLHESMRTHNPDLAVPSCSNSLPLRPIVLGRLWQDAQPTEEAPRLLLRLLVDVVAAAEPERVPRAMRIELGELLAAWDTVKDQLQQSPIANLVDLEQLQQAIARVAIVPREPVEPEEPVVPRPGVPSPHPLVTCEMYSDYPSPLIPHMTGNHKYHEQCLREYFIRCIQGMPEGTVYRCPRCIIPFDEALVQRLLPDLQTIKSNAMRAWREQSTQQIR